MTATGDVLATKHTELLGFYVCSTSSGTIVLKQGGSSGTAISGTITPAVGFHAFPAVALGGLHATIGGTLDVTFFYRAAN
jgi:hypothetical protein